MLNEQTRKYLADLLKIPELANAIYIEKFGPDSNPFGKGPWVGVTLELHSANGLELGSAEGDGYCTYDFWIEDSDNSYLYEHMFEYQILDYLPKILNDRLVAYRSFHNGVSVAFGVKDTSLPVRDAARSYDLRAGCLFPFKAKRLLLQHNVKSWNGKWDGVVETTGYF